MFTDSFNDLKLCIFIFIYFAVVIDVAVYTYVYMYDMYQVAFMPAEDRTANMI